MLKTYRFIPIVFILWLFGFTLITVSPVFAEDSPEFIACQQMKWKKGKKAKKNCFRDLALRLQQQVDIYAVTRFAEDSPEFIACQQMKWKKGKEAKKNCFRDLARRLQQQVDIYVSAGGIRVHTPTEPGPCEERRANGGGCTIKTAAELAAEAEARAGERGATLCHQINKWVSIEKCNYAYNDNCKRKFALGNEVLRNIGQPNVCADLEGKQNPNNGVGVEFPICVKSKAERGLGWLFFDHTCNEEVKRMWETYPSGCEWTAESNWVPATPRTREAGMDCDNCPPIGTLIPWCEFSAP